MKIRSVVIVQKRSAFQMYFGEYKRPHLKKLAAAGDRVLAHLKRTHKAHYASLQRVIAVLKKRGIRHTLAPRGSPLDGDRYDLVITVGGDGTLLDASKNVKNGLLLGLNSDAGHSVGKLCAAKASDFARVLDDLLKGRASIKKINRLRIRINGKDHRDRILNDILVCHAVPAAMSHYVLVIKGKKEQQRSSGVWVATAAGSTGAMLSAGGKRLPIDAKKIQYMPRELFAGHGIRYRLRGGIVPPGAPIRIISQMVEGMIYADGAHVRTPFRFADRLEVLSSRYPLRMVWKK